MKHMYNHVWMYEVKGVKELLDDSEDKEHVFKIINVMLPQLKKISEKNTNIRLKRRLEKNLLGKNCLP